MSRCEANWGNNQIWADGIVNYKISSAFPKDDDRIENIKKAIEYFNHTVGKFINWRDDIPSPVDYVVFEPSETECSSYVGKKGGKQSITIAKNATKGNVLHEMGHAIGLLHEHQRHDRDEHVFVENPNSQNNKIEGSSHGDYDYKSIMHYPEVDGKGGRVLTCKVDIYSDVVRQNEEFSNGDIACILEKYNQYDELNSKGLLGGVKYSSIIKTTLYFGLPTTLLLLGLYLYKRKSR